MKKSSAIILVLVVLVFFFLRIPAQAAPVGSPASLLKKGEWDFSIEGGYINERPMESEANTNYHVNVSHGYHTRSYGLTDRITIKGRVGGTYGYIYDQSLPELQGKTSLSGGLGLGLQFKGIIFEKKDIGFEWDGSAQYLYMRSHHKRRGKANADWYEWQLATCIAKAFNRIRPFVGVKYSTVNLDYDDGKGNKSSYNEDGGISPFVGTDIYFGQDKDIVFYMEAAFLLGYEAYGGLRYKF